MISKSGYAQLEFVTPNYMSRCQRSKNEWYTQLKSILIEIFNDLDDLKK